MCCVCVILQLSSFRMEKSFVSLKIDEKFSDENFNVKMFSASG